jgi:dienelactone hydrolase
MTDRRSAVLMTVLTSSLIDVLAGAVRPQDLGPKADVPLSKDGTSEAAAGMLARDVRSRQQQANLRENQAWAQVKTRADWERFREERLRALRESLGLPPADPAIPRSLVSRTLEGDGYRIENLVFESRPGLMVTANLYRPDKPTASMPGIVISHSHHNPKTQGELQEMGMTWARQGCVVLIPDHLGHGERRQHPFHTSADYPRPFRAGRQDYYFRYNTGIQLQLIGESLMGWMVWDLMRGLDLLLARPGVDKDRVILLGSVAGGGDPAAVTAALDPRVKAIAPFNFGGPQPDYAVPDDPARDFYYFGVPEWESTRCLRLGARDGFAHWLIVGSVAPRRLIYAHEFAWEWARDPVWPRLLQVFRWYDAADRLAVAYGRGTLKGSPREASHCNNIGPLHRAKIYPTLERWFGMPIPEEYSRRRGPEDLLCLTPEAIEKFRPRPLHELAAEVGTHRAAEARMRLTGLRPEDRRRRLRQQWARLLGDVEPRGDPSVLRLQRENTERGTVEHIVLEVEQGIVVPVLLRVPPLQSGARAPIVLGLPSDGKQAFVDRRSDAIAQWLDGGSAVCLVDARGTGDTRSRDGSRRHHGALAAISAAEWMLGQTLVGSRLRDVRSILRYLRHRPDLDARRIALWGDSFAPTNAEGQDLAVPLDVDPYPHQAEPLGGLLALFGALFEDDVRAVYARGCLTGFDSLLKSPFIYVPHDALIPGALTAGDLCDVAAALAPRPLWMEAPVDGLDRPVKADALARIMEPVRSVYRARGAEPRLKLGESDDAPDHSAARWLLQHLLAH